jgi:DNA-binding MurR/RpiR family transcriptional regulator
MSAPNPAPQSVDAFQMMIGARIGDMPKRLRQCAEYIAANCDRIAVSTVAELAAGAGVPPSAVMRFCQVMGFSGFSDMQKLFREAYSPKWPDYATRLANLQSGAAGTPARLLAEFIDAGQQSLAQLATSVDSAALSDAVLVLAKAQLVHIAGMRRAYPIASYLAYVFEKMGVSAMLHDGAGGLDHRHALRAGDALIAISFAPYSDETLSIAATARARGLSVVALTDHFASPLARHATAVLPVQEVDYGAFRAMSATIALALSLAISVAAARDD